MQAHCATAAVSGCVVHQPRCCLPRHAFAAIATRHVLPALPILLVDFVGQRADPSCLLTLLVCLLPPPPPCLRSTADAKYAWNKMGESVAAGCAVCGICTTGGIRLEPEVKYCTEL